MNANEIIDCPRCDRVLVINEGFAYCDGCGGLYMTEAEAQRRADPEPTAEQKAEQAEIDKLFHGGSFYSAVWGPIDPPCECAVCEAERKKNFPGDRMPERGTGQRPHNENK